MDLNRRQNRGRLRKAEGARAPNSTFSMRQPAVIPRNGGKRPGRDGLHGLDDLIPGCRTFLQLPWLDLERIIAIVNLQALQGYGGVCVLPLALPDL